MAYLNSSEVSIQEAVYCALPNFWLRKTFPKVVLVNTNQVPDRIQKLNSKELLRHLDPHADNIFLRNDHMKYSDRPNEQYFKGKFASIDELCFAQFLSFYAKKIWCRQQHDVSCDYQPDILEDKDATLLNFNSHLPNPTNEYKRTFLMRKEPAVIRYYKLNFSEDREKFYHHRLMFYFP